MEFHEEGRTLLERLHKKSLGIVELNPIQGDVCKFSYPYLDVTKRKKFSTFNIIILDIFCENLACIGPALQIL